MGGIISYWPSSTSNSIPHEQIIENHPKERKKRRKENTITHGPRYYKNVLIMPHSHYCYESEMCGCVPVNFLCEQPDNQRYFRYRKTGKD